MPANSPPRAGIYGCLLERPGFALFGPSRHLAKGGLASMSFLDVQLLSGHLLLPADFCRSIENECASQSELLTVGCCLITVCVLADCATYSKVSKKRPRYVLSTRPVGMLANAEVFDALSG